MENHANTSFFFQELYRAFNNRLVDTVLASFHEDVDWPASSEGGWPGDRA